MYLQPVNRARHLLPLFALLALLPACASNDVQTYRSTVGRPLTIQVVDPYTQKVYFTKDIPPDDILTIGLDHENEVPLMMVDWRPATSMTWELYGPGSEIRSIESGRMDLPGTPLNIVQKVRPGPEYPMTATPPPSAAAAPAVPPQQQPSTPPMTAPPPPANSGMEAPPTEAVRIELSGNTTITIADHQMEMDGLKQLLEAIGKEAPARHVLVCATTDTDKTLCHKVLAACHGAGLTNVTFVPTASQPSR
jgi:biopolymer transport protein ExbD